MLPRFASSKPSKATQTVRELKKHIHRLYKHIHPDKLGRFPEQRAVNEASLQVLQSALDRHFDRISAKITNIPPQAPLPKQKLTFYVQASFPSEGISDETSLKKADVAFQESNLAHSIHTLFQSLGLEPPPDSVLPPSGRRQAGAANIEFNSLSQLVRHARQMEMASVKQRHAESASSPGLDDEVLVTRLALQRSRGISVVFGGGLPAAEKLTGLFRRLNSTLHGIDVDLRPLVIELDGGFGVQFNDAGAQPWLLLGACASGDAWQDVLRSEQVRVACERCRAAAANLRLAESKAAKVLCVKLVMHNFGNSGHDTLDRLLRAGKEVALYEELLGRIRCGRTAKSRAERIVVMVEAGDGVERDVDRGVLKVGMNGGAEGILAAVNEAGGRLNAEFEWEESKRVREMKRVRNVIRALGVGGLRRGEVSDIEWGAALGHLREDAGRLRGVFDGMSVVVGRQARFLAESGEVEIPFDFYQSIQI